MGFEWFCARSLTKRGREQEEEEKLENGAREKGGCSTLGIHPHVIKRGEGKKLHLRKRKRNREPFYSFHFLFVSFDQVGSWGRDRTRPR